MQFWEVLCIGSKEEQRQQRCCRLYTHLVEYLDRIISLYLASRPRLTRYYAILNLKQLQSSMGYFTSRDVDGLCQGEMFNSLGPFPIDSHRWSVVRRPFFEPNDIRHHYFMHFNQHHTYLKMC